MAYQALYRKYRPASFDEVVGQRHIVQTLKNAIHKNRIAHAYLFCGPRGTGKTSIAKIFARTLNCTGDNPPCMECENCRLSLEGSHPDIIEIDAASNNGVDEVRALIDKVGYAPMEGKYKVYIIDEVHMMTSGAFNALLKTIEEPPAHVIFIFATTEPHKVLPTILSRCQRYDFSKVSDTDIVARLNIICQAENIQTEPDALSLIASLADGGMRDALSILDQCAAYDQEKVTAESVREIYGVVQPKEFSRLMDHLNAQEVDQAVSFLEELEDKGMDLKRLTADLISLLKDSFLYDMAPQSPLIQANRRGVLENSFSKVPYGKRMKLADDLMSIYNKFAFASNVMDYIETAILKASLWENQIPLQTSSEANRTFRPNSAQTRTPQTAKKSNTEKPNLSAQFWQSDVSRETFRNEEKPKSEIRYSEDFLLQLLAGADKQIKEKDQIHMNKLSELAHSLPYAKFADQLRNIQIMAAADTYWLIVCADDLHAQMANDLQEEEGFEEILQELTGTPKKVFAVSSKHSKQLVKEFRKLASLNQLPEPAQIEVSMKVRSEQPQLEEELKQRFPDLVIKDD